MQVPITKVTKDPDVIVLIPPIAAFQAIAGEDTRNTAGIEFVLAEALSLVRKKVHQGSERDQRGFEGRLVGLLPGRS